MTEPGSSPVHPTTGVKHGRWLATGMMGCAVAVGMAWMILCRPKPETSSALSPTLVKSSAAAPFAKPTSTTVQLSDPVFHPWPAKPQVIGPPVGVPPAGAAPAPARPVEQTPALPKRVPEPPAPSIEALAKEAARTGEELVPEDIRVILLDEKQSSAIKLALIDKLRTQNPDEVIPILVAFLETPASPAGIYTCPTAVKVLSEFKDPRANEALARLSQTSNDERVRLTIAALQAKEKTR